MIRLQTGFALGSADDFFHIEARALAAVFPFNEGLA